MAEKNKYLKYFNVSISGLSGKIHRSLSYVSSLSDVRNMRIHTKMLAGNYLTYQMKSEQSGGSSACRLCSVGSYKPTETLSHTVATCLATSDVRNRILQQISDVTSQSNTNINIQHLSEDQLTQYILDPCSLNLTSRIHPDDPVIPLLYKLCRDLCTAVDSVRLTKLKSL